LATSTENRRAYPAHPPIVSEETDGARLVAKHAATAADACPSIKKKHVTPHTLRHSAAMTLLKNGVDTSVIALWLGHEGTETTQIYIHADMTIKEQALARVQQPGTTPGRYRPPDTLLAFLDNL
jgi:integrase